MIATKMGRALYSSEVQQPIRATAVLDRRPHTHWAAQVDREEARATRRPPPGVRVIVTSRPDPGLPDDVPVGHPLRTCIPHPLAVSWVAEDLARRASQELRGLLAGDQPTIDVVGYIAGSGGGLTRSDLSALTGAPPLKLDPILRGVFGRSLQTRAPVDIRDAGADPAMRVYLFAHETLRVTAEEQLGGELARYREGVHDWIGSYASGGWPATTPGYAIRGYPRLLTATSDVARLSALARDPSRHAFLLRATESDYAALAEIRTGSNEAMLGRPLAGAAPASSSLSPSATTTSRRSRSSARADTDASRLSQVPTRAPVTAGDPPPAGARAVSCSIMASRNAWLSA